MRVAKAEAILGGFKNAGHGEKSAAAAGPKEQDVLLISK